MQTFTEAMSQRESCQPWSVLRCTDMTRLSVLCFCPLLQAWRPLGLLRPPFSGQRDRHAAQPGNQLLWPFASVLRSPSQS
jgi:hypothetical protein